MIHVRTRDMIPTYDDLKRLVDDALHRISQLEHERNYLRRLVDHLTEVNEILLDGQGREPGSAMPKGLNHESKGA